MAIVCDGCHGPIRWEMYCRKCIDKRDKETWQLIHAIEMALAGKIKIEKIKTVQELLAESEGGDEM